MSKSKPANPIAAEDNQIEKCPRCGFELNKDGVCAPCSQDEAEFREDLYEEGRAE